MGEHANDILEGSVCQECGEWFDDVLDGKDPPGYPRICNSCTEYDPCIDMDNLKESENGM